MKGITIPNQIVMKFLLSADKQAQLNCESTKILLQWSLAVSAFTIFQENTAEWNEIKKKKNFFARSRKSLSCHMHCTWCQYVFVASLIKLLSFYRSCQGALQGGGMSSHSYSSSSYCHGQSSDKAGKKNLSKSIQTYGFHILCFTPFLVNTSLVLWFPHLQLQQGLNHSQSKLLISKWFGSNSRDRLSSFPMLLLTNGYLNSGWVWNVSAA